ncbi:MAG: portal protein [Desulfovibrio sp.]
MSDKLIADILKRYEKGLSDRATWLSHVDECYEFCKPRKAGAAEDSKGGRKHQKVYNGVAEDALDVYASGMNGGITPQTGQWFLLEPKDAALKDDHAVKAWTEEVTDIILSVLEGSNFQNEVHEVYIDSGVAGTACMYMEEDPQDVVRFSTRHYREYVFFEDHRGKADTCMRKLELTARQAKQKFGDAAGERVKELLQNNTPDEKVVFIHAVYPRTDRNVQSKHKKHMPFASLYIEKSKKELVQEGGYVEFPFAIVRNTKVCSELDGRSPAMKALYDIEEVQRMERTSAEAAEKMVNPAILAPNDNSFSPMSGAAGKIMWYEPRSDGRGSGIEPFPFAGNPNIGIEMVARKEKAVRRPFLYDIFITLPELDPNVTAAAVNIAKSERLGVLGPTLGRHKKELLEPVVMRVFGICNRAGMFPPPPENLNELDVRYTSPLILAQEMASDVEAIDQDVQFAGAVSEVYPEVWDNLDLDEALRTRHKRFNGPSSVMRDKKSVAKTREEREKAQAAAQQQEAAMQMAPQMMEQMGGMNGGDGSQMVAPEGIQ